MRSKSRQECKFTKCKRSHPLVRTHICVCFCNHFDLSFTGKKCKDHVHYQTKFCSITLEWIAWWCTPLKWLFPKVLFCEQQWPEKRESEECVWTIITLSVALSNISALLCFSSLSSIKVKKKNVFLFQAPSWFYPCRFPFLIRPFDRLKHQFISTRSCGLCLPAVHCLPSRESSSLLGCCPSAKLEHLQGKQAGFYMEECLNVVQLVGSHTGRWALAKFQITWNTTALSN